MLLSREGLFASSSVWSNSFSRLANLPVMCFITALKAHISVQMRMMFSGDRCTWMATLEATVAMDVPHGMLLA